MKKKVDQIDINNMNDKLAYKIFDLYIKENEKFYIDKKMGWIWDKDKNVVGVVDKTNKLYFFDEIKLDDIILEDLIFV
jgi:hypothetical protein